MTRAPIRLLRIIARLNIGGPSIQAITLTNRLERLGYATTLVRGAEGVREGNMDALADELGVGPLRVPTLRRDPGLHDVRALISLIRIVRRTCPQVVHTHAAKAGTLGRLAALIARPRRERAILVHTFHGHSLSGYFAPRTAAIYRFVERLLARFTDCLVAVSDEVRDELVALRVAPPERFRVIPLGFDLSPFQLEEPGRTTARSQIRRELHLPDDVVVVTLIARLVPIKRVDRFLRAAASLKVRAPVHFLIVGDGELAEDLQASADAAAVAERTTWTGFRDDIPAVCFTSDIVVLCSDNEGTPVSLIEAGAAGVPTVSTNVGGTATVVLDGRTGLLVERDDDDALGKALALLIDDTGLRDRLGDAARSHVASTFSLDRLTGDLDALYRDLLGARSVRRGASNGHSRA